MKNLLVDFGFVFVYRLPTIASGEFGNQAGRTGFYRIAASAHCSTYGKSLGSRDDEAHLLET